ncbi:MAG: L-rhamnose mutarotase [Leifsonia sp.]
MSQGDTKDALRASEAPASNERRERHAQLVKIVPARREEYLELHRAVWPEVEDRIRRSNIENYSIFILDDLLIAYFEYVGSDIGTDMAAIAADPVTQQWWKLTAPCQVPMAEAKAGSTWAHAEHVWRLSVA